MTIEKRQYRVGFLGCPARAKVEWNDEHLLRLKELGFNTMQLNIAWGSRPGKEALNLEDLVDLPGDRADLVGKTPMLGDQSPECRAWRRDETRKRIDLCRKHGLHTIFHFGTPYVGDQYIHDAPENCLLDGKTEERSFVLLREFAQEFPGVDDILVYTYDQHAWLCSEFGPCPRCTGKTLHGRVAPYLEKLAALWREVGNPDGRLWWEPWELSAGQVLQCADTIEPEGFGFSLHCNIAEVMGSFPADRWLKNTVALAAKRGIPSLAEYWLGGPSEEVEPYTHLAYPLVTLRGLKLLDAVPELAGTKEYYGLLPDQEDPNLRMTGLFFNDPAIEENTALETLAEPYGPAAASVIEYWRHLSEAMDLFPWETSWIIRAVGNADPCHALSAAMVRGTPWHTPSWMSTRRNTFMVVDTDLEPDPWMLEDIQLRCALAADRMGKALAVGRAVEADVPEGLRPDFSAGLEELHEFRRRALAYVYHCRETNLATAMRERQRQGLEITEALWAEMGGILEADLENQEQNPAMAEAVALFNEDRPRFLDTYFKVEEDKTSRGHLSVTSR